MRSSSVSVPALSRNVGRSSAAARKSSTAIISFMSGQSESAGCVIQRTDRALGALYGLAIGDALGMPTQMLSRERIVARFGR